MRLLFFCDEFPNQVAKKLFLLGLKSLFDALASLGGKFLRRLMVFALVGGIPQKLQLLAVANRCLTVDERIVRRLTEISSALADKQGHADEHVAAYCARLNKLVSAMLSESRAGRA